MSNAACRIALRLQPVRPQALHPRGARFQVRFGSTRYSNPTRRSNVPEQPQAPSFVDSVIRSSEAQDVSMPDPLAARAAYLAGERKREYHLRKMRLAGMGLLMSIMGLTAIIYNLDLDQMDKSAAQQRQGQHMDASGDANQRFQGKEVQVIGVGESKKIVAKGQQDIDLVETGTSSVPHFPRTIYLPTSSESAAKPDLVPSPNTEGVQEQEEYTLVGLGIRSVSFLSIQVYVVGMYIRTADVSALQARLIHVVNESASTLIPSEKEKLREVLLDPSKNRQIWNELLQLPGLKTAWRIAPTRNTDFGHLRDGWITGINNRIREARQSAKAASTEYDSDEFGQAIGDFKGIFSGGKAPKGSVMILSRGTGGNLEVWFQPKPDASGEDGAVRKLGNVSDERISRLIWLGYLAGEKVSSEAARQGVVDGCVGFAARPIGSIETMVV